MLRAWRSSYRVVLILFSVVLSSFSYSARHLTDIACYQWLLGQSSGYSCFFFLTRLLWLTQMRKKNSDALESFQWLHFQVAQFCVDLLKQKVWNDPKVNSPCIDSSPSTQWDITAVKSDHEQYGIAFHTLWKQKESTWIKLDLAARHACLVLFLFLFCKEVALMGSAICGKRDTHKGWHLCGEALWPSSQWWECHIEGIYNCSAQAERPCIGTQAKQGSRTVLAQTRAFLCRTCTEAARTST